MISKKRLEEWRKLCDKATPGPWRNHNRTVLQAIAKEDRVAECDGGYLSSNGNNQVLDARFIAAARTALPALLDEVEALRDEVERLREALQFYADDFNWTHLEGDTPENPTLDNYGKHYMADFGSTILAYDDGRIARKALGRE